MATGLAPSQPLGLTLAGRRCNRTTFACFSQRQSASPCGRLPAVQQLLRGPRGGGRASRSLCSQSVAAVPAGAAAAPESSEPQPLLARAAAVVLAIWQAAQARLAAIARRMDQPLVAQDAAQVNAGIKSSVRNMRRLAVVMPFAAISNSTINTLLLITRAVSSFIKLYLLLLFLRVLLSWFPAFNWENQPWLALRQVTDPYLNLFRGLVPPLLGTIDFTPLFGFMILQLLAGVLEISDENSEVW